MAKPLLIIITGLPCTGKTTIGKRIAEELHLPYIHKDGIKELLFDALGWDDREWSRKLGRATFPILFYFVEVQLKAGRSLIVESNFTHPISTQEFRALQAKYDFAPFQIQCIANGEALFQRFQQRAESGERHPGHREHLNYDEGKPILLAGRDTPLDIGGVLYEVDTTNFAAMDYEKLLKVIRNFET